MVARSIWLLVSFGLLFSSCKADDSVTITDEALKNISIACSATRFPELCVEYVSSSPRASEAARDPGELVKLSMQTTFQVLNDSLNLFNSYNITSGNEFVSEDIQELLSDSANLLLSCIDEDIRTNTSLENVRHWLSAALTYNNDCQEMISPVHPSLVTRFTNLVIPVISNSLWMVDAYSANPDDFTFWKEPNVSAVESRREISDDFVIEMEDSFGQTLATVDKYTAAAIVSHDPLLGTHSTIQAAVNDAPSHQTRRYVIYITAGTYDEIVRIPSSKSMIAFIGDGINRTIIRGNLSTGMNLTTFRTATLAVSGDGFLARDLTVVNDAGPENQAVAMRADSDMSAFHRCSFWGYQDTLYTHAYRQFYRDCAVYGTVDFVFGNAASVFQNCQLVIRLGGANHTTSTVTAQGRTDPVEETAFVCQSCAVVSTPEYLQAFMESPRKHLAYLGRPWKPFARSVFIGSYLDVFIDPSGWLAWNGTDGLDTITLAEYRDYGPGANPGGRVAWSQQLSTLSVFQFTVRGLIQGGFWLPFTGVPYRLVF